jgi:serine O-acetyltransferase
LRILQDNRLKVFHPICFVGRYIISRRTGLEILPETRIGKGFRLVHPYNITINPEASIGSNVNIYKGATIGYAEGKHKGVPIIGDFVQIGINSTIVGGITVGNDVLIAPNTFLNIDVPDHSIVIGNPAQIISRSDATKEYINFVV